MDKLVEQKIRERLGKGTLYEVHVYRDGYDIIPNKKDFVELASWDQYCSLACIGEVSDNKESIIISELRAIFGDDAGFLYYSESTSSIESMEEDERVIFPVDEKRAFTDFCCGFIVCQPKKKELNFDSFSNIEDNGWCYGVDRK